MRKGITISVSASNRQRLEAIVSDRNTSQKYAWRSRIILLTGAGVGTNGIMAATGKSKTTVWRWQERFAEAGVEGLLSDKTRPPGKPPVAGARVADLVRLTLEPPPHEATHWTARAMAKAVGLGVATVQKIWKAHGLAPHRFRAFKLSNDPAFAEKLHAIVGLHVSPPAHAVVLSVDEKSQIQALDRTQPGPPMKKGRGATMTHDYKRHDTTTLFAASTCSKARCSARTCNAIGTRSSSASSTRWRPRYRQASSFMPFSTITPHTKPRRCGAGWRVIRAGASTSRQPQAHGSMPLKASSPISPAEGSSTACSAPSPNSRPQSTASSPSTTDPPNRLYGAPTPTKSSPLAQEGSKRWSQSTRASLGRGWVFKVWASKGLDAHPYVK